MGGGSTLPGFPVDNPTISYWQLPPHHLAHHRTTSILPVDTIYDYVVIGSGISGAAVSYKLLLANSNLKILMLEARTAASGASGRNGGHCRAGWWTKFKHIAEMYGEDEALKFEELEEQNVQDIATFVHEHDVQNDFENVETAEIYVSPTEWASAKEVVTYREKLRQRRSDAPSLTKRKVIEGEEARKLLGMPHLAGAILYPAHTQNPYLLVCKMLELCLERGLNLQTDTVVTKLVKTDEVWTVETERGNVKAKAVVLATNGYTNALYPALAKTEFLCPARNQVSAIRPQLDISRNPAFQRSADVKDLMPGDIYFMARAEGLQGAGDILVGGARKISATKELHTTDDSFCNADISSYVKDAAPKFFGRESWGQTSKEVRDWSGIVCYTSDGFPLVGEAPDEKGLWCTVGMNGHGMAMAFRCAEALVSMMLTGKEPRWLPTMFRLERAF